MYKFSQDPDLTKLIDRDLNQKSVGRYDVQFRFDSDISIMVHSGVDVLQVGKQTTWSEDEGCSSTGYQNLLNQSVIGFSIVSESVLQIAFTGDWKLRIYDESGEYESLQIYGLYDDGTVVVTWPNGCLWPEGDRHRELKRGTALLRIAASRIS